jgi:hypothetical protein
MPKAEQIAYPLMIVAAVGTLYLLFRRSGQTGSVNTTTAPIPAFGAIPPLQELLTAPSQLAQGPAAVIEAMRSPYSVAPGTPAPSFASPSYLTYNMQPLFRMFVPGPEGGVTPVSASTPAKSTDGCDCGGACGSKGITACQSCESPCDSIKARYPDGRGGCMTSKMNISGIPALAAGLQSFSDMLSGYATISESPDYAYHYSGGGGFNG